MAVLPSCLRSSSFEAVQEFFLAVRGYSHEGGIFDKVAILVHVLS